jgi:hypothetical protein
MQCTSIGKGQVDYKFFTRHMTENCPGVPIHVETVGSGKRTIPFLDPEFLVGFADVPASGIADFLQAIKLGRPVEIPQPIPGADPKAFEIELQKTMLHESLDYLRNEHGVGLKS